MVVMAPLSPLTVCMKCIADQFEGILDGDWASCWLARQAVIVRHCVRTAAVGPLLAVALGAGAAPALAGTAEHGPGPHHALAVHGLLIGIGSGSLQVQTQLGTVTVPATTKTLVLRKMSATTADLRKGETVDVRVARGTTTARWISILPTLSTAPSPHRDQSGAPARPHKPHDAQPGHGKPSTQGYDDDSAGPKGLGQVVSSDDDTLTVKTSSGKTFRFTLTNNTQIVKTVVGRLGDLAIGQMVSIMLGRSGSATQITILTS